MAQRTLAANSSEATQILAPSDSPDHAVTATFGTPAQCENGAMLISNKLHFEVAVNGAATTPIFVAVLLYKDAAHGDIAPPTTAQDVINESITLQLAMLKKNTCHYAKFLLSVQGDKRSFFLRIPKRMRTLRQGEAYTLVVTNGAPATTDITWFLQGRMITAI